MAMKSLGRDLKEQWSNVKATNDKIKSEGRCVVRTVQAGMVKRLQVVCPYSADFVRGAQGLNGSWRARTGVWTFDTKQMEPVYKLCIRCFGRDKVNNR